MQKIYRVYPFLFLLLFYSNIGVYAQEYWQSLSLENALSQTDNEPVIEARTGEYFAVDFQQIYAEIQNQGAGYILELPTPNKSFHSFKLENNTTMSEGLQLKFPQILSFTIVSAEDGKTWGKLDVSPKGIFAMYQTPGGETVFIDPLFLNNTEFYAVYYRSQFVTSKVMECSVPENLIDMGDLRPEHGDRAANNTCELRTYRLAVSATGEYTQFHGGTVSLAMAAIVTTINRVNMIYERDLAVTLELVPNNEDIIYTNAANDPFTNGNPGAMIAQNGPVINSIIGATNYDIGHVFGTNSGGLAGFAVVCKNNKASGVTGSGAPVGDPFDIDYVSHEMGHQFGANHTFNNSCDFNRNNATAVEPGSGSTIMAYAGICNPNVQNNSDDHFHGISLKEIGTQLNAHTCGVKTNLDNTAPVIDAVPEGVYVPVSTPFALTATVHDDDADDVLTYNWEQMDNQISNQPPQATATNGPNFRSFSPDTIPTRYFPRLQSLASSLGQTWERITSVERTMLFRVSVRDNAPGGGCTQYENTLVNFVAEAGPFLVTYPNLIGIEWNAFSNQEVTWDVANTDQAPISCETVDIYLSIDGGKTYPILVKEDVPNTGSTEIVVPNHSTNLARIMVINSEGTFFDISYNNFKINGIENGFYLNADSDLKTECVGTDISFTIHANEVGSFNGPISLSVNESFDDITATFNPQSILPGESSTLTFSNNQNVESGYLNFTVIGTTADDVTGTLPLTLGIIALQETEPELFFPENEAEFVSSDVNFSWEASNSPDVAYRLQIATDNNFQNPAYDIVNIPTNEYIVMGLDSETTYYWRVKSGTQCAESGYSESFVFSTNSCFDFESDDVPITIPSFISVRTSEIEITSSGIITDVNIPKIMGTHARVSDLVFELKSPQGTSVILMQNVCNAGLDFDLGFDDAAQPFVEDGDCPPTSGNLYIPYESLSAFNGEDSQGIWTLTITDGVNGASGSLDYWDLQICIAGTSTFLLTAEESGIETCQNQSTTFTLESESVFGFDSSISLTPASYPAGVTVSFNPQVIQPGEASQVTVQIADGTPGTYNWSIFGEAGSQIVELPLEVIINEETPQGVNLQEPIDNSEVSSSTVYFEWEPSASPSAHYTVEFAYDPDFTNPFASFNVGTDLFYVYNGLPPVSTVYWRVKTTTVCGESLSQVNSILTGTCDMKYPTDLPKNIPSVPTLLISEINVPYSGNIQSLSVVNLSGTHLRVSDLKAELISPSGTTVTLFDKICDDSQDFHLSFADDGIEGFDCPPTTGNIYQSEESLSAFIGENSLGVWKLHLRDLKQGATGTFNNWALEICYEENVFGLFEANPYNLNIYPNPVTDVVTIDLKDNTEITDVRLLDVSGKVLNTLKTTNQGELKFDLSQYAAGAYFIHVNGARGNAGYKIIKTK